MTEAPPPSTATSGPRLLITNDPVPGLRSVAEVRDAIRTGFAAQIWEGLRAEAEEALRSEPYLPTSVCPGRAPHHAAIGNRDFTIVDAVARRLKNGSLIWLLTGEERFQRDALRQMETVLDESRWPQWIDGAHSAWEADLRTGMLLRAFGYAYDWLSAGLSAEERRWIVDGLDRRAIQPYCRSVERGAWFTRTERMNNWNTVIVGGAGTAAMALGDAHPQSAEILRHAEVVMTAYLDRLGTEGEFDESVGYAGAMCAPVEFFATHRYHTRGEGNLLGGAPLTDFCRWYMHFILPPGRSARFGDCPADAPPKASVFAPIAAAARDEVLQWFYMNHAEPNARSDWALELLFFDPSLSATSPEGRVPRGRAFRGHGAIWSSRTDWNPRSTACVVYGKAGHGNECHGHHDAGQVCIDAFAQPLIVDLGHPAPSYPEDFFTSHRWRYYNAGVVGHNVLMFGGREMRSSIADDPQSDEVRFNEHHADHWRRARVCEACFDDSRGGYWQADTTPLYRGAVSVRRTVVHLHPGIVAVLDEAELEHEDDISLRWHTATSCSPDSDGRFIVTNNGVNLSSCVARIDGGLSFRRGEHAFHPPYDKARLGPALEQRREPYVEAVCHARTCRIVSLFSASAPGVRPSRWEQDAEGWRLEGAEGQVRVRVSESAFAANDLTRGVAWSVPLSVGSASPITAVAEVASIGTPRS